MKPSSFSCTKRRQQPSVRLFCFPHAGGSEHLFRTWPEQLPQTVEVCAARLPGHGARILEPALTQIDGLIDVLMEELPSYLDQPYALFGHSMGALLSFELARAVRRKGLPLPVALFVSGHRAPQLPPVRGPIYHLPDDQFTDTLRRYNGTPPAALENEELMALMIPILRADFQLCDTYQYRPEPPLNCHVMAFGGLDDADVSRAALQAWEEQSTHPSPVHLFPGDHFYLRDAEALVLQHIAQSLTGQRGVDQACNG